MTRLSATIGLDMRLQARNKLYVIGIGVAVCVGLVARYFLESEAIAVLVPGVLLGAVGGTTFMFVAGMVMFEKGERTLDALIVTPLPVRTYLGSKVITLTGFATVESLLMLLVARSPNGVAFFPLILGVVFLGTLYTLVSIAQAVAQTSVTDFLVPGGIVTLTLLQVPALYAFDVWSHPLLYLFPTQATVVLMKGAFGELAGWQWAYGIGYSLISIAGAFHLARWRFQRLVVEQGGRG